MENNESSEGIKNNLPSPSKVANADARNRADFLREIRTEIFMESTKYPHYAEIQIRPDLDNPLGFTVLTKQSTHIHFQIVSI
jgi:hypothetical protein